MLIDKFTINSSDGFVLRFDLSMKVNNEEIIHDYKRRTDRAAYFRCCGFMFNVSSIGHWLSSFFIFNCVLNRLEDAFKDEICKTIFQIRKT